MFLQVFPEGLPGQDLDDGAQHVDGETVHPFLPGFKGQRQLSHQVCVFHVPRHRFAALYPLLFFNKKLQKKRLHFLRTHGIRYRQYSKTFWRHEHERRQNAQFPHVEVAALHGFLLSVAHDGVLRFGVELDRIEPVVQKRSDTRVRIDGRIHRTTRNAPVRVEVYKDEFRVFLRLLKRGRVVHPVNKCLALHGGRGYSGHQQKENGQNAGNTYATHANHFLASFFFGSFTTGFGIPSSESIRSTTAFWKGIHWASSSRTLSQAAANVSRV